MTPVAHAGGPCVTRVGPQFARLAAIADQRHIPLSVTFEISQTCNLHCVHCYNFDRDLHHHPDAGRRDELSTKEIHRIIDEVRQEGTLFIAFTGGEPTSHPSVADFVAHASGAGMFTRLKSNGTRLTPSRLAGLVQAGLKAIDLSIYGATADTHDAFVRQLGAFDRTVAGCQRARDAGIAVQVNFVLSSVNAAEVEGMIALANGLGVPHSFDPYLTERYDGSSLAPGLKLNRATTERLYRGPLAPFVGGERRGPVRIACPCARSVCGIGSSGEVYPCIGAPLPAGNLKSQSFREIWRHSPTLQWVRSLTNEDFQACASCEHAAYCRRNSGVMLTNTGSFTGPAQFGDDFACIEAEVVHTLARQSSASP